MRKRVDLPIGIICCRVLEKEVHAVVKNALEVTRLDIIEWGRMFSPIYCWKPCAVEFGSLNTRSMP